MPAAYAHLMITEKTIERIRDDCSMDEKLCGVLLTHPHFVHLGSVGPDYPYLDFFPYRQTDWADHMHYKHRGNGTAIAEGSCLLEQDMFTF